MAFLRRFTPRLCCGQRGHTADDGPDSAIILPQNPKICGIPLPSPGNEIGQQFQWPEIESFTERFTSPVIGKGGFSSVHLARLPSSSAAAVKLLIECDSSRLLRAFNQELEALRRVSHPHIVRLIGYARKDSGDGNALVLEYVSGGTLHDRIHGCGDPPLSWDRRMSAALRLAEALDYLHERGELPIIHGDITAANVLIDDRRGPVLCDFGSALVGFSAAVKPSGVPIVGSPGYADPHYLRTGIVSKKTDVYGFGVLLTELVAGEAPAPAFVPVTEVVPTDVEGFDAAEAEAALQIAALCVGDQPTLRPSMAEVIRLFRERLPSSISDLHFKSDGIC